MKQNAFASLSSNDPEDRTNIIPDDSGDNTDIPSSHQHHHPPPQLPRSLLPFRYSIVSFNEAARGTVIS